MALIFIKIGLKLSYFCQKKVFFECWWIRPPTPYASGGWRSFPQTPIASGGWGIRPQTPQHLPPSQIFGYAPTWRKIYCTLLPASICITFGFKYTVPGTFGEEDVLIHERCIIRPKVFHPVILIQKNYLKKSFHLHQSHFGFGRDEVFSSWTLYALLISSKGQNNAI